MNQQLARFDQYIKTGLERRSVLSVMLHLDRGWWRAMPAFLLIFYNFGIFRLVTRVGALRDEEERSGYSPDWSEYHWLIWVHRGVSLLFYVSLDAFFINIIDLLGSDVYLPKSFRELMESEIS
jgi:hypothetical protein